MPLPPKKKKAGVGIELLLGEPEAEEPMSEEEPGEEEITLDDELPEDDLEDEAMAEGEDLGQEMAEEDALGAESESTVDPEHAALAEKLGFRDPEQQQALVDLIQLVLSSDSSAPAAGKDSGALPPLPESVY